MATDRAHDPGDSMNGAWYHTGRPCAVRDCLEPAGTAWGPNMCQRHNAEQLDRMSHSLAELGAQVGAPVATREGDGLPGDDVAPGAMNSKRPRDGAPYSP